MKVIWNGKRHIKSSIQEGDDGIKNENHIYWILNFLPCEKAFDGNSFWMIKHRFLLEEITYKSIDISFMKILWKNTVRVCVTDES